MLGSAKAGEAKQAAKPPAINTPERQIFAIFFTLIFPTKAPLPTVSCAANAPHRLLVIPVSAKAQLRLSEGVRSNRPRLAPTFVAKCSVRPISCRLLSRGYVLVSGQQVAGQDAFGSDCLSLSDQFLLFHPFNFIREVEIVKKQKPFSPYSASANVTLPALHTWPPMRDPHPGERTWG